MNTSVKELSQKSCMPCEGGVPPVGRSDAEAMLRELEGWGLSDDGLRIHRKWTVQDFMAGIRFLNRVADLAEAEGHHPDVQLTGYRHVTVELTTHAIGGLSENDFILAAKINDLPVELKN